MTESVEMVRAQLAASGHGHVVPARAVARCGGPALCTKCSVDAARLKAAEDGANRPMGPVRLPMHVGRSVARGSEVALSQVGWLGQTGTVYALDDEPRDCREPGSYAPLLIQIGTWVDLGGGHYAIKE